MDQNTIEYNKALIEEERQERQRKVEQEVKKREKLKTLAKMRKRWRAMVKENKIAASLTLAKA